MPDPVVASIAKELVPSLYADMRAWLVSLGKRLSRGARNAALSEFNSPAELLASAHTGATKDGEWIRLKCKPSPFGPFLRTHFITPLIGFSSELRLGPPILSPNPIISIMANAMSHLVPVGLYPTVAPDILQGCLYPAESEACGMIGILPGVGEMVQSIPALIAERHTGQFGAPSWITGVLRRIDSTALEDAGYSREDQEGIRQSGVVWFFDATDDDSRCYRLNDGEITPLWGGLYASGHLEILSGSLTLQRYVGAFESAFMAEGFEVKVNQNQAGQREIALYARGFRATLSTQFPLFSFHMDAELSKDFASYRSRFDRICEACLRNLEEGCADESVELGNPCDVDFTYANGAAAYSVLRSYGASAIGDPLAIAIRDWHRRRSVRPPPSS